MDKKAFSNWLNDRYSKTTAGSRLSNCSRIESYEGDLDEHFSKDKGASLIDKLTYSKGNCSGIVTIAH